MVYIISNTKQFTFHFIKTVGQANRVYFCTVWDLACIRDPASIRTIDPGLYWTPGLYFATRRIFEVLRLL